MNDSILLGYITKERAGGRRLHRKALVLLVFGKDDSGSYYYQSIGLRESHIIKISKGNKSFLLLKN